MQTVPVKVLRTVNVAADEQGIMSREIVAGTDDVVPKDAFEGLRSAGYVAAASSEVPPAKTAPHKSGKAAGHK